MIQHFIASAIKYILFIYYGIYILNVMFICKLYTNNTSYIAYKLIFHSYKYKNYASIVT